MQAGLIRLIATCAAVLFGVAGYVQWCYQPAAPVRAAIEPRTATTQPVEADAAEVHGFCGSCHAYPPPAAFPRAHWAQEVRIAYDFFRASGVQGPAPDLDAVAAYYERRAPLAFPAPVKAPLASSPWPTPLETLRWRPPAPPPTPGVTNVQLAHLFRPDRLDLLVCHTNPGRIWAVKPYESPPSWHLLAEAQGPCHVETVDLDGDGQMDLLVAELGSVAAIEHYTGRVIWLRNAGAGRFTPITLLDGVGRVADVRAADLNGDGKLDLVVAVFGWHTGQIVYLENRTTDWTRPTFERHVLDGRSGALNVPVGDINGDGHPDIVALLAQEYETVLAFLGDGKGGFAKKTIYAAPHPAYGSSGIELVDLDGNGTLDVLYTNGDILDPPHLLKPYHSVQWLENRRSFPFAHHPITAQYGVMRAVAADLDGDGLKDIVSVAFLPPEYYPTTKAVGAEAVQILRQVAPGRFERHVLETGTCDHVSCAVGDLFGDGRTQLVVGNYCQTREHARDELLTVWKDFGRKR